MTLKYMTSDLYQAEAAFDDETQVPQISNALNIPVGASLLAIAVNHSTLLSTDSPPSRASSLPQVGRIRIII
ncbi:hypothetical protein ACYZT9_15010 [Pseudomonas sp. ZT5P21]